jgi:hypothetical protein
MRHVVAARALGCPVVPPRFPLCLGLLPCLVGCGLVGCGGLIDTGPGDGGANAGPDEPIPIEEKQLTWMRQFGSAGQDKASAVTFSASGAVLLAGWTSLGTADTSATLGKTDSFVRRYDADGEVEWARQFGTTDSDGVYAAVARDEDIFVAGYCRGALPGQKNIGDSDAYVSRLLEDGTVAWTRQFGSSGYDVAYSIATDETGALLVAGYVELALPGQTSAGKEDAFWAKFDESGSLLFARQFGGAGSDIAFSACSHPGGEVTVVGSATGQLGTEPHLGKEDGFVRRFDESGNLAWSHQFGGASKDVVTSAACLGDGSVVVGGYFYGTFDGTEATGSYDGFLRKYDAQGGLVYSRVMGTEHSDYFFALSADAAGHTFVAGATEGEIAPPTGGGDSDSFVLTVDDAGRQVAAWQFGSRELGEARAVALGPGARLAVAGYSQGALPGQMASGAVDAYAALLD